MIMQIPLPFRRLRLPSTLGGLSGSLVTLALLSGCTTPAPPEPIGKVADMMTLAPELQAPTFRNQDRLYPTRSIKRGSRAHPLPAGTPLTGLTYTVKDGTFNVDQFMERNRTAGLLIIKDGKVVLERYAMGNTAESRYISFSVAKAFTSTLIGVAIQDGYIHSLDDSVTQYVPALAGSAYDGVTVKQVLQMSSGVGWNEDYLNPESDNRKMMVARTSGEKGAALRFMRTLKRVAPAGSVFNYSTGETYLAGEILAGAIKQPLSEYFSKKIWAPFGMEAEAYWQLESQNGQEYAGSGVSARLRDYGRFGLFVMHDGVIDGKRVLPEGWMAAATNADPAGRLAPGKIHHYEPMGYGYQWWTFPIGAQALPNLDGGMYAAHGIFGQSIYVNPQEKIVVALHSAWPKPVYGKSIAETITFVGAATAALRP